MLIGLWGYARSGKDTVGDILDLWFTWRKASFAAKLKAVLLATDPYIREASPLLEENRLRYVVAAYGWERAKDMYPEIRRLLQALGTEGARDNLGEDVWVDAAMRDVSLDENVVFTDMRFANEARAIKAKGGYTIAVSRPGYGPINDHLSEVALVHWPFDGHIYNNGSLDDLKQQTLLEVGRMARLRL